MLYVFALMGTMLILFAAVSTMRNEDWKMKFIPVLVGVILVVPSIFFIEKIDTMLDSYEKLTSTTEIYEIKESSKVSGKGIFYLKINEDAVYTYHYKQKDGGYKYGSVPAKDTVIYENEDSKPLVKTYSKYTKNNWSTFLTKILFFSSKQDKLISERYEIYVPKGSIIKESTAKT